MGAANWSGAGIDPETGYLYVPSESTNIGVLNIVDTKALGGDLRYIGILKPNYPPMPHGLPLTKPPYSRMTAVNMNTGDHAWMTPLGNGDRIRNHPMLKDLHLPPLGGDGRGGPLVTKTLLFSAITTGGSNGGPSLVAFDKATGKPLASVDLPGAAIGTPMTYMVDGKQYIALTVEGNPPELVAFTLP